MIQNPTCVKITQSIFMNKETICFHAYQANRFFEVIILIGNNCRTHMSKHVTIA